MRKSGIIETGKITNKSKHTHIYRYDHINTYIQVEYKASFFMTVSFLSYMRKKSFCRRFISLVPEGLIYFVPEGLKSPPPIKLRAMLTNQ